MPELYEFQKRSVKELLNGRHICVQSVGSGKSAVMMKWLAGTGKRKVLIITTASKRDSHDMDKEADTWNGEGWRQSLDSFEVIGWAGLAKWVNRLKDYDDLKDYAVALDEVQASKHGVQSQRGKAFLQIAQHTECWSGYTATPGDSWIDYQAYAIATGLVKNLTCFRREFCQIQTYKGFPEIVGYHNTQKLQEWWDKVSTRPDTSEMYLEMPKQTHKVINLPTPKQYKKLMRERETPDGEFIETTMGLCHAARQMCVMDKARQQWLKDYMESNPESSVFFTNYKEEAEMVAKIHHSVYPKAKVWMIDGQHHDIPTADTIGKNDIVVANYQSGSEGLNLQFLHYTVFVSPNYSYSVSKQAKGRINRIGQTKLMFYYTLMCDNSIEQDILECLHNKKDFAEVAWAAQIKEE